MPTIDNPFVIIGFALLLSVFYWIGMRHGFRAAKHLYDQAMKEVEHAYQPVRQAWKYIMENSAEARQLAATYARVKAEHEAAERPGPPPSRIIRESESAGRPPSPPSGVG